MPKVSILIPIYNVERYLRQCLDSVVNQTLKDIEIICINDGSTDNSLTIINEFAAKDSRIKVIDKKNTGYGHSMNCGLKMAQGEYIGIIESDDFTELNMFEVLYNHAKNSDAEIIRSNHFEQIYEHFNFVEVLHQDAYNQIFTPRLQNYKFFSRQVAVWSGIYKRDFLSKNEIYFTETPDRLLLIKDAFVHYRVDNPNSSVKSKQKVFCIFDEFDEIERFLAKRKDLYNPCRYIFESVVKFQRCEYHFTRIDMQFKFVFFQRMFEEFLKDNNAGYLDKKYWTEKNWQNVQQLLNDKEIFFYNMYERLQRLSFYANGFFEKIKQYDNLYLYGAGKAANRILCSLFQNQLNIKGIAVSSLKDNPLNIMDVPVTSLSESNIDNERDAILISVKEDNQYEILYKLQSEGLR